MLGEFYSRAYSSFIDMYMNLPKQQQINFHNTTQLYVVATKLLLSHETFFKIFSSNYDVLSYKKLIRYGPIKDLHPINSNNNNNKNSNNNNNNNSKIKRIPLWPQCTCVKRLYFCSESLRVDAEVEAAVEAEVEAAVEVEEVVMDNQPQQKPQPQQKTSIKHLSPSEIQQHIRSIGSPTKTSIQTFRTQLILQNSKKKKNKNSYKNSNRYNNNNSYNKIDESEYKIDESEYKIIGLTQRSGRRRWLNLDELIDECNRRWFYNNHNHNHNHQSNNNNINNNNNKNKNKTLCVEINLENNNNNNNNINTSELQILWHSSMNAIVGIHGAQLTHAVWLRPESLVVELLPWVMDGLLIGGWTKDVTGRKFSLYACSLCICICICFCICFCYIMLFYVTVM